MRKTTNIFIDLEVRKGILFHFLVFSQFLTFLFQSSFCYSASSTFEENTNNQGSIVSLPHETLNLNSDDHPNRNWKIRTTLTYPIRGFQIQTKTRESKSENTLNDIQFSNSKIDELNTVFYSPPASLESSIFLSYKIFSFSYRHTLVDQLRLEKEHEYSVNEEYRLSMFTGTKLLEFSRQNLRGLETKFVIDRFGKQKRIIRPDISYTDWRFRAVYGISVFGSDVPSLSNYYYSTKIESGSGISFDILYQLEPSWRRNLYSFS